MGHVSTSQAARRLGVSAAMVAGWCRDGSIPAEKVNGRWRISEAVIQDLQARLAENPAPEATPTVVAAADERKRLNRLSALLGDLRAAGRGPLALGQKLVRKSTYRTAGRKLRKLLP